MKCLAPLYVVEEKYQKLSDRKRKVTDMREDMIQITKEMVKIPSINTTEGERKIGEYIENFIRTWLLYTSPRPPDRSVSRTP